MATAIILLQFAIVMALILKGARVGGIGLGIYGMVGVFILVFIFGLKPGRYVVNHSLQTAGFITTFVSIGVGNLIVSLIYLATPLIYNE